MTFRERLAQEHPENVKSYFIGGCKYCPAHYGYEPFSPMGCPFAGRNDVCCACWDREMPDDGGERYDL